MAEYSFAGRNRAQQQRNENVGNVVLKVDEFDHQKNAVTGHTRDGEVMTIRLANKDEFANMFVNRTKHTTQDARERIAAQQTSNRPNTGTLQQKMTEGEGAIQFQGVKKSGDELVARWMESVATTADDTYVNAQIRIQIPRSNEDTAGSTERRRADVILEDTATAATMDALDSFTTNRITGDDGKTLDGHVRSALVVAVQAADDPGETPTSFNWTSWDKEAKEFKSGGEAMFDAPLNNHNWETMVPLAAAVGKPFDELKFDSERVNAEIRTEHAPALYAATEAGNIKVAVAQGFTAEIMPQQTKQLVASEATALESDGRRATMSDRGFFNADVGLRTREGQEGYSAQTSVKTILANEFLPPKAADNYAPKSLEAMGQQVIAKAEAGGQTLTVKPNVAPEPAPQPEPKAGVSMTASTNSM